MAIKFTVSILLIIRYDRKYFIIGLFRISIAKWRVICFRHQTVTYVYFHKPALYADIYEYRCITSTRVGHFRSRQQINNSIFPGLLSSQNLTTVKIFLITLWVNNNFSLCLMFCSV